MAMRCADNIRGTNMPCVVELTSIIADVSAGEPVVFTATPWALAVFVNNNTAKIKEIKWIVFFMINFCEINIIAIRGGHVMHQCK